MKSELNEGTIEFILENIDKINIWEVTPSEYKLRNQSSDLEDMKEIIRLLKQQKKMAKMDEEFEFYLEFLTDEEGPENEFWPLDISYSKTINIIKQYMISYKRDQKLKEIGI